MKNEILISNLDKLHTTELGVYRIKRNFNINVDNVVSWCKRKIRNQNSYIYKKGKNWYVEIDNAKITINSYSYTIITAHKINKKN